MANQLPVIQPIPLEEFKPRGRIAVIGAGLTGVSSAAHAIAHGFDVVIYEQSDSIGKYASISLRTEESCN